MLFLDTGGQKGLYFLGEHGRSNSDEGANIRGQSPKKARRLGFLDQMKFFQLSS